MNKAQFIELIQKNGKYNTKVEAENALQAFIESATEVMVAKDEINIPGFGIFETAEQKGKTGKVPNKDTTYTTEDKTIPKFRAGKNLKERVSEGK